MISKLKLQPSHFKRWCDDAFMLLLPVPTSSCHLFSSSVFYVPFLFINILFVLYFHSPPIFYSTVTRSTILFPLCHPSFLFCLYYFFFPFHSSLCVSSILNSSPDVQSLTLLLFYSPSLLSLTAAVSHHANFSLEAVWVFVGVCVTQRHLCQLN